MQSLDRVHFLDVVCAKLREPRPPAPGALGFSSRFETVLGAPFVGFWFRTRGCRHDARGGCTMCNYGAATPVSEDEMVELVRRGLGALGSLDGATLLLSPSGSMFDEWEVPARVRERTFRLARQTKARAILCETRVDTLTDAAVQQYADIFNDRECGIGLGLESATPWVLKYCVNKALSLDGYRSAVAMLRRHGVLSTANVLLGPPFLSEAEAIEDSVASIRWAFAAGVDQCVLFPAQVKSFTLVEWLWQRLLYSPPSLWSLIEVLSRVGPELTPRVTISWYKDYGAGGEKGDGVEDSPVLASPSTCSECHDAVMALLDEYRDRGHFDVIQELAGFECDCRLRWLAALQVPEPALLAERVAHAYEAIGRDVLGEQWWLRHGETVLDDVLAD